jgi:hypothetical protein
MEAKLDEACWSFCSQNYSTRDNPVFPEECIYQLFRIFCMLADMVENDAGHIEVSGSSLGLNEVVTRRHKITVVNMSLAPRNKIETNSDQCNKLLMQEVGEVPHNNTWSQEVCHIGMYDYNYALTQRLTTVIQIFFVDATRSRKSCEIIVFLACGHPCSRNGGHCV